MSVPADLVERAARSRLPGMYLDYSVDALQQAIRRRGWSLRIHAGGEGEVGLWLAIAVKPHPAGGEHAVAQATGCSTEEATLAVARQIVGLGGDALPPGPATSSPAWAQTSLYGYSLDLGPVGDAESGRVELYMDQPGLVTTILCGVHRIGASGPRLVFSMRRQGGIAPAEAQPWAAREAPYRLPKDTAWDQAREVLAAVAGGGRA